MNLSKSEFKSLLARSPQVRVRADTKLRPKKRNKRAERPVEAKGAPSKRKYGNELASVDGITFHSKREARRYAELKLLERGRVIVGLELQVRYPFVVHGVKICSYIADFTYEENGKFIVEDSKGFRTREYQIKKKLLKALFGYDIRET